MIRYLLSINYTENITTMKFINYFNVLLFVCLFVFVCCRKEEEAPANSEYMSAQVNGKAFKASTFVVAKAGATTSINGTFGSVSNPESIGLSIQNAKVGTFKFTEGAEDFAVYKSTSDEYITISGTLQITAMSQEWIEGNFSFVAHSINNSAQHLVVSDGKFKMKYD